MLILDFQIEIFDDDDYKHKGKAILMKKNITNQEYLRKKFAIMLIEKYLNGEIEPETIHT